VTFLKIEIEILDKILVQVLLQSCERLASAGFVLHSLALLLKDLSVLVPTALG
jgi:hypothetical protein